VGSDELAITVFKCESECEFPSSNDTLMSQIISWPSTPEVAILVAPDLSPAYTDTCLQDIRGNQSIQGKQAVNIGETISNTGEEISQYRGGNR